MTTAHAIRKELLSKLPQMKGLSVQTWSKDSKNNSRCFEVRWEDAYRPDEVLPVVHSFLEGSEHTFFCSRVLTEGGFNHLMSRVTVNNDSALLEVDSGEIHWDYGHKTARLVYDLSRKTTSTALTVALAVFMHLAGVCRRANPIMVVLVAVLAAAGVGAAVTAFNIFADGIREGWKPVF